MSWFQSSSNFASIAKNALKEAQKTIDKALDIKHEGENGDSKSINTSTVSTVTDAAAEFFSSWSNFSSATTTSSSGAEEESISNISKEETEIPIKVVTTSPSKSTASSLLTLNRTLSNSESKLVDYAVKDVIPKTENVSDVSSSGLVPDSTLTITETTSLEESAKLHILDGSCFAESSFETSNSTTVLPNIETVSDVSISGSVPDTTLSIITPNRVEESKVHLLEGSDSVESSIETSNSSTTVEAVDELSVSNSDSNVATLEVSASNTSESTPVFISTSSDTVSLLILSSSSLDSSNCLVTEFAGEGRPLICPDSNIDIVGGPQPAAQHDLNTVISPIETPCSTLTSIEFTKESNDVEVESENEQTRLTESLCEPIDFPSTETLEFEGEVEPISSKLSISSRATSSISVISEEKDSSSSPQISPASQSQGYSRSSVDSPSFEIISMPLVHPILPNTLTSLEFLPSVIAQNHCSAYQPSMIHSLQSTPDRGTPQTHSRSNSNTSSSFDRIEDANIRLPKYPGQHFMSSTSSSDIEVIPMQSTENLHLLYPKRKSMADIETQTLEPFPERTEYKEKVVEMIPAKMTSLLAEKDFEITQLREEGEKLSKKQFELSSAIKKLRQKEKETDGIVKSLKNDLVTKNIEMERISKTLIAKETQDQAQTETINRLNSENRKLLNTINQLRSDLDDSKENASSMKVSVEEASLEILQLQNTIASVQRDTTEMDHLTQINGELKSRSETLQKEVDQLRTSIDSHHSKTKMQENDLKTQIHNLTQDVYRLENLLADNSSEIADATMPLSLEIEKLQQELKNTVNTTARKESSLQSKISEYEHKITIQLEIENGLKLSEVNLRNSVAAREVENKELREELAVLSLKLAGERRLESENEKLLEVSSSLNVKVNELSANISALHLENDSLNTELTNARSTLQAETKRNQHLSEQLLRLNQNHSTTDRVSFSSAPQDRQQSRNTSPHSVASDGFSLDDVIQDPANTWQNPSLTPKSYFDSFSSVNYIENLQGHLKHKELELFQLQHEVSQNEKIRKSLNDEIARLTLRNEEFLQQLEKQDEVEQRLAELNQNYNAILQMYGEKVEEADELRMDLEDVKEMYKVQIEQLLKKAASG